VTAPDLHLIVPGTLEQRTGGYIYDATIVEGLRALGHDVRVHNLEGRFPDGDERARHALDAVLDATPEGALVVADGLAMGGLPEPIARHGRRLRIVALVHHALADEAGITPEEQARFFERERAALAASRGVIVTSPYTAARLGAYGVPPERIRAVLPGTEPARAATGPPEGEAPLLLCVATVTPRKGHDVLVQALDRVADLDWRCTCAGSLDRDRPWAESVLDAVSRYGLQDRIDFVGDHDAEGLDALYDGASLLALASRFEGYGMALAEALARGLPIVSTTGGAIPYTVPADAGVLVPPDDPVAFASGLRTLLESPSTRMAHAAAALRHGRALPDWEAAARAFARALEELAP